MSTTPPDTMASEPTLARIEVMRKTIKIQLEHKEKILKLIDTLFDQHEAVQDSNENATYALEDLECAMQQATHDCRLLLRGIHHCDTSPRALRERYRAAKNSADEMTISLDVLNTTIQEAVDDSKIILRCVAELAVIASKTLEVAARAEFGNFLKD
ncbi:hypothetical protein N7454_000135 [Penicillium verhagenii]|nr:hypothetical protein N7454_000135 [Penicillium verhagenii]